jgi:hypothetical protein
VLPTSALVVADRRSRGHALDEINVPLARLKRRKRLTRVREDSPVFPGIESPAPLQLAIPVDPEEIRGHNYLLTLASARRCSGFLDTEGQGYGGGSFGRIMRTDRSYRVVGRSADVFLTLQTARVAARAVFLSGARSREAKAEVDER